MKPKEQLDPRQVMKMANKPDMILLFARHLAEQKRREGYDNVEVRAKVTTSLNGRKPQVLIDPTVDLAKESRSLLPARGLYRSLLRWKRAVVVHRKLMSKTSCCFV